MKIVIVVLACLASVLGHPQYRDIIPNGYNVPNPCLPGTIWEAVGHYDAQHHTIDKNVFAQAFAANGHMWTRALCMADSDRDGMTNGEELGDPTCVWAGGSTTATPKGHPGICEPVGSAACSHQAFYCGCHNHQCSGK